MGLPESGELAASSMNLPQKAVGRAIPKHRIWVPAGTQSRWEGPIFQQVADELRRHRSIFACYGSFKCVPPLIAQMLPGLPATCQQVGEWRSMPGRRDVEPASHHTVW